MKNKILILPVVMISIVLCTKAVLKKKEFLSTAQTLSGRPIPVQLVTPKWGDFIKKNYYVATSTPQVFSFMNSKVTAEVVSVNFREGDRAKKGDVLIELDDRSFKQNVLIAESVIDNINAEKIKNKVIISTAETSVYFWKKELNRAKSLFEANATTEQSFDSVRQKFNEAVGAYETSVQNEHSLDTQLSKAYVDLELAKTNLSYTKIYAPYDCILVDVPIEPGVLANPNLKVLTIQNTDSQKLIVKVPQQDLRLIKNSSFVEIKDFNRKIKITKIYPALDSDKLATIEIDLPSEFANKFMSGEFVNISIIMSRFDNVLILPVSAVKLVDGTSSVYKLEDSVLREVKVHLVSTDEEYVAIRGSITEKDKVVVSSYLGWAKLSDGLLVEDITNIGKVK